MVKLRQLSAFVLAFALGSSAFAAGYEKNILWSGRHAGVAGTGAGWASGPEALYFNPAGLVTEEGARSVVANISPTTSQFKAPVVQDNQQVSGSTDYYLPFAVFYGATPTQKFGYGAGIYVGGGSKATFGELDISSLAPAGGSYTVRPSLYSDLAEVEASVGGAYQVMPGLKVGAAYRFIMAEAAFSSLINNNTGVAASSTAGVLELQKLKGYAHGFRLGAQYAPEGKPFGLGISWRSGSNIALPGTSSGAAQLAAGATNLTFTGGGVTVHTTIPTQVSTGGYWDIVPEEWRGHLEYVWTQYSKVKSVGIDGTFSIAATAQEVPDIEQQWRDQHSVRIGAEYMKTKYPIRFGYGWTSAVENPEYARAIFHAPGETHTLTLGTGRGNEKWDFNIAADYNMSNKDATPRTSAVGSRTGSYMTTSAAIHTGVTYKF